MASDRTEPPTPAIRSDGEEDAMIKALLTPVILGLTVAMIIRLMTPRRA